MLMQFLFWVLSLLPSFLTVNLRAEEESFSKIDLGAAYACMDILDEHKEVAKTLHLKVARVELDYITPLGWYFKPIATYGRESNGELFQGSFAFGRYFPLTENIYVAPLVGVSYLNLNASIDRDFGFFGKVKTINRFRSWSPCVALEITIYLSSSVRISVLSQYAWSYSRSIIKDLDKFNSNSRGPNIGAQLDYDLCDNWLVNVAYGYNESLSRAKSGLRVHAVKIGFGKWL